MSAVDEMVSLGQVTSWLSGGTPDRSNASYWTGTIPWVSASTLQTLAVRSSPQKVTKEAAQAGSRMAPLGSTLLLVRGSALHSEIRASLVEAPVCFNQDVKALVPKPAVLPRFLTYSIHANADRLLRLVTSAGNTAGVLETSVLKRLEIWIPPRPRQETIIRRLDDIEADLESLEQLIEKKEEVKRGLMHELLSGQTRLPGFLGRWEQRKLGEVANVVMGHSPPSTSYNSKGEGIPLVQGNADIRNHRSIQRLWTVAPIRVCRLGDVLMSVRAPVGSIGVATADSCIGRGVCGLRAKGDQRFLFHRMVHAEPRWGVYAQGSTFTSVNSGQIKMFEVTLPGGKAEQAAIAEVLDDATAEIDSLKQKMAKMQLIKKGAMQQMLRGRASLSAKELATA